jgi:hypothetical protein
MKLQTVLMSVVLASSSMAFAQTTAPHDPMATPRIDQRQANQEKRIDQGVASGQLTAHEAKRLEKGEQRIGNAETRAKADGTVTAQERKHLTRMENKESHAIYRQKHDGQRDMNHDGKRDHRVGKK